MWILLKYMYLIRIWLLNIFCVWRKVDWYRNLCLFQVELRNSQKELERKEDLLETSRHVMDVQERELEETKDELSMAEHENKLLRKSMEMLSEEANVNR